MFVPRRQPLDTTQVIVQAQVRLPVEQIIKDFKLSAIDQEKIKSCTDCLLVQNFGFTKLMYSKSEHFSFMSTLKDLPKLIESLESWISHCKVPRFNNSNLSSVVLHPSESNQEFEDVCRRYGLSGMNYSPTSRRFSKFAL